MQNRSHRRVLGSSFLPAFTGPELRLAPPPSAHVGAGVQAGELSTTRHKLYLHTSRPPPTVPRKGG